MVTKTVHKQPQETLAWGWTFWGCVQKFNPSYIFLKSYPILPLYMVYCKGTLYIVYCPLTL